MSSSLKQFGVCFIIIALLKVSQGFSVDFVPDIADLEPRRQARFAAPRGKRDPLIDVNVQRLLGLYVNPSKFSDFYKQRQERFAAPRGKRDPYELRAEAEQPDIEYPSYFSNFVEQRQTRSRFAAPRGKRLQEMAALGLSEADTEFLLSHKDQLMNLLSSIEEGQAVGKEGYFAFPRQGRAMSFYFPRMGRTGQNTQTVKIPEDSTCCSEGVRSVYAPTKGMFEICPSDQLCCAGLEERTKLYQDLVITDCTPVGNTFEGAKYTKLRELMTEK